MTEHNIFQEIEEDIDRQKLEDMWKRYGSLVIAAAIAAVIATGGVTAWHSWRAEKNQQATAGLMEVIKTTEADPAKAIEALEGFAQKNHGASQATFAHFHAAILAVQQGDKDKAVQIYDGIASDGKTDAAFRQLADLMAVRIQMDTGSPALLQKRLQPLLAENAPWRFTAMEYTGFLALRDGDKAKAAQVFTELSQNASAPQTLTARAADMLRYVRE